MLIPVSQTPSIIGQSDFNRCLIVNQGASDIYLDDNSAVTAANYSVKLVANQSVNWAGGTLWAVTDGAQSLLSILNGADTTVSPVSVVELAPDATVSIQPGGGFIGSANIFLDVGLNTDLMGLDQYFPAVDFSQYASIIVNVDQVWPTARPTLIATTIRLYQYTSQAVPPHSLPPSYTSDEVTIGWYTNAVSSEQYAGKDSGDLFMKSGGSTPTIFYESTVAGSAAVLRLNLYGFKSEDVNFAPTGMVGSVALPSTGNAFIMLSPIRRFSTLMLNTSNSATFTNACFLQTLRSDGTIAVQQIIKAASAAPAAYTVYDVDLPVNPNVVYFLQIAGAAGASGTINFFMGEK